MQSLTYSEFIPKRVDSDNDNEEEYEEEKPSKKKGNVNFKEFFTNDNCPTCHRKFIFVFDSFDFIILIFFVLLYIVIKK
jgi:hypothetical protein